MITLHPMPPAPTHLHLPPWRANAYAIAHTQIAARPHVALTPAPDGWPQPEPHLTYNPNAPTWRRCDNTTRRRGTPTQCRYALGQDTSHPGVAYCKPHGGNRGIGLCTGAWIMGHAFSDITGTTTPWDALEMATQIAANKVIAIQQELGRRLDGNMTLSKLIEEGGYTTQGGDHPDLPELMKLDVMWFDRLTKVAKWSIDAGLGERMMAQIETDGAALALAARKAVEELGYDHDRQAEILAAIGRNLRAIEAGDDPTIIEGQTT